MLLLSTGLFDPAPLPCSVGEVALRDALALAGDVEICAAPPPDVCPRARVSPLRTLQPVRCAAPSPFPCGPLTPTPGIGARRRGVRASRVLLPDACPTASTRTGTHASYVCQQRAKERGRNGTEESLKFLILGASIDSQCTLSTASVQYQLSSRLARRYIARAHAIVNFSPTKESAGVSRERAVAERAARPRLSMHFDKCAAHPSHEAGQRRAPLPPSATASVSER